MADSALVIEELENRPPAPQTEWQALLILRFPYQTGFARSIGGSLKCAQLSGQAPSHKDFAQMARSFDVPDASGKTVRTVYGIWQLLPVC